MNAPQSVAGLSLTSEWRIRRHLMFLFEAEAGPLSRVLPRGVHLVEARPGIALLAVAYLKHAAGNMHGRLPEFDETTFTVVVQPDLSLDMPTPRFSFFVLNVGAGLEEFTRHEASALKLPTMTFERAACEERDGGLGVRLSDARGPIFELHNTHPQPAFTEQAFFGQFFTVQDGGLYQGIWSWHGRAFEHQRAGEAGTLSTHPYFGGQSSVHDCWLQMMLDPAGPDAMERFYGPRLLRSVG